MEFRESSTRNISPLEQHISEVIVETGFEPSQEDALYTGKWYDGTVRSVVIAGEYEGKPAVIKAYDDPRPSNQPRNLELFNAHNKSNMLHAPALYTSETQSATAGWMIMQRVPEAATMLAEGQLSSQERRELLP